MRATWPVLMLTACYAAPMDVHDDVNVPPAQQQPPIAAPQVICDMAKFSFTKESGCVNDGWVEFCAVKAGAPVVTSLRGIAPEVSIQEGVIGRAGCSEGMDYFVSLPLAAGDCMAQHGALTDTAWDRLCALSQVPETKHFVPGFAE